MFKLSPRHLAALLLALAGSVCGAEVLQVQAPKAAAKAVAPAAAVEKPAAEPPKVEIIVRVAAAGEDLTIRGIDRAKAYTLEFLADGTPVLTPTRIVSPGGPGPNPTPAPGPLTPLENAVQAHTVKALAAGGTKTTGAGLSEVYSRVAASVGAGTIPPDQSLAAVRAATNAVMLEVDDDAAWTPWRTAVGEELTRLQQEGSLTTKAQHVSAFKQIAGGLNAATGYSPLMPARSAKGILDGIDIDKILKLIDLIIKLLTLFGGVK